MLRTFVDGDFFSLSLMISRFCFFLASLNEFGLNLNDNELSGPIPTEFGQLVGVGEFLFPYLRSVGVCSWIYSGSHFHILLRCRCLPYNIGKLDFAANNLTGPIISELGLLTAMGKWLNLTCDWSCGFLVPNLATHILVPLALANSESLNLNTNQLASSIPEQLFSLVNLGAYEKG